MKIFSAAQIHKWDEFTMLHEPITSIDLMERAAAKCTAWLIEHFAYANFKIFCAKGNNGGDGLAIGRQLIKEGLQAEIFILEFGNPGTPDFQTNLNRLHDSGVVMHYIQSEEFFPGIAKDDVVIECLYGTGLNRPLDGLNACLIDHINKAKATVVAIDVPGGMFADKTSVNHTVVNADYTLTFQQAKLAFYLPENQDRLGKLIVLNIGLHNNFSPTQNSIYNTIDFDLVAAAYKPRKKFSHKGNFGHALVVAGSKGKMGACLLASKACLRMGAGMVSAAVPKWGMKVIQTAFPEAMALPFQHLKKINFEAYGAIGLGPGLGTEETTQKVVYEVLKAYKKPMVIDADGLNIISKNPSWFNVIPQQSILTPHPKEFERLFGKAADDFEKIQIALHNARSKNIYILIKGHHTFIACPNGEGYFNTTGNAGMATAGSGDVLTGILTGLLCQGYSPMHAVLLGVYFHGAAGDTAAQKFGMEALLAGDIIKNIGNTYQRLFK